MILAGLTSDYTLWLIWKFSLLVFKLRKIKSTELIATRCKLSCLTMQQVYNINWHIRSNVLTNDAINTPMRTK